MTPTVTLEDYWMGRHETHKAELTPELIRNAAQLVRRVNMLISMMHDVDFEVHPVTHSLVSSGWRPAAINASIPNAAPKSRHMSAQAIDLYDPDGDIDGWCIDHLDLLGEVGLWLEHPSATKSWSHLQSVPPKSGRRMFFP